LSETNGKFISWSETNEKTVGEVNGKT